MSASHEVAVDVTGTTADVRRLLDYVDAHAPSTATLNAVDGKLVAKWTADPGQPPTPNRGGMFGFGPVDSGPHAAEVKA